MVGTMLKQLSAYFSVMIYSTYLLDYLLDSITANHVSKNLYVLGQMKE